MRLWGDRAARFVYTGSLSNVPIVDVQSLTELRPSERIELQSTPISKARRLPPLSSPRPAYSLTHYVEV